MSKYHQFQDTLDSLERRGVIEIKDDMMTILKNEAEVKNRLMETQWGAMLLMGAWLTPNE